MKLCRYGNAGSEKAGLVDHAGRLRDLSGIVPDIGPNTLAPETLAKLAATQPESLLLVEGNPRIGVPVNGISKYIAIGLNYSDHAREANMRVPPEPIIFMKAISCLCGPNDDTLQPRNSSQLDWEVELAVVIGRKGLYVSEDEALDYVAGYCLANDVSERAFQLQSSQWDKGKGCDTFGPLGPWLVTTDEITNPQNLDMWLDVNGERMQSGNTSTIIFGVKHLVSYCSRYMTLSPGDVIATGTPPGVGLHKKPHPVYLKPGDIVTLGIAGLGQQRQKIIAPAA